MPGLPSPSFDINRAKKELCGNYADYVCGRVIGADIYSGNTADPSMYDRDNGVGSFQQVVNTLRNS